MANVKVLNDLSVIYLTGIILVMFVHREGKKIYK